MRWFTTTLVAIAFSALTAAAPVTVYDEVSFGGTAHDLTVQNFTSAPSQFWRSVSSLKVQPGYVFVGYSVEFAAIAADKGKYFYMTWDSDAASLGSLWDKTIVAYEVRLASAMEPSPVGFLGVAMINAGTNYGGGGTSATLGPSVWTSTVGSVRITPGYAMVATLSNGSATTILADTKNVGAWTGPFRSIVITKLAATQAPVTTTAATPGSTPGSTTARPTPTSTPVPTTADHTLIIVACAVGGVLVLVLGACFVVKRKKTKSMGMTEPLIATDSNPSCADPISLTELYTIRLDAAALRLDAVIGFGSFAEVWKGTYSGTAVAVKQLQPSRRSAADIRSFISEVELMARFDSPHIIKLVGAVWTSPRDLRAVMELMDQGDLKDYLAAHDATQFTWLMKLEVLRTIVAGLAYLHSLNIVHRDLKSRNVLLDSVKGAKIVDFGIAKEDVQGTMTMGVGTFRWMAPEVLHDSAYTVAADIYSLGMLLSEMDSHHIPYQDLTNPATGKPLADPAIIGGVMNGTIKPTFSETCPPWVKSLANACLQFNAVDRPTIYDVAATLAKVRVV